MSDFNPNSFDAQFATVLTKLEAMAKEQCEKREEDKAAFKAIMDKQDKTNGRVTGLEKREQYNLGKVAGIAVAISILVSIAGAYFAR